MAPLPPGAWPPPSLVALQRPVEKRQLGKRGPYVKGAAGRKPWEKTGPIIALNEGSGKLPLLRPGTHVRGDLREYVRNRILHELRTRIPRPTFADIANEIGRSGNWVRRLLAEGPDELAEVPGKQITRCDYCGREGNKYFITLPLAGRKPLSVTICKDRNACAKRWREITKRQQRDV